MCIKLKKRGSRKWVNRIRVEEKEDFLERKKKKKIVKKRRRKSDLEESRNKRREPESRPWVAVENEIIILLFWKEMRPEKTWFGQKREQIYWSIKNFYARL